VVQAELHYLVVTNRVPGGSGERRPRATEAARCTRTSSSPEAASRRGAPSPAMSAKRWSPGAMGARRRGGRGARVSGLEGFEGVRDLGILSEGFSGGGGPCPCRAVRTALRVGKCIARGRGNGPSPQVDEGYK
jgi:hypothetical protein